MTKRKYVYMPVDEKTFRLLLLKKGFRLTEASEKIGHASNYLSCSLKRYNAFPVSTTLLIEKCFGIKYEEYALVDNVDNSSIQNDDLIAAIHRETRTLADTVNKIYDQLDKILEVNQALLKKHIGLEETIFKGSKRALEDN